jgi:transketolase
MRTAFINELVTLAATHENIALIVGDLGYSVIEPFADLYPDRFINAGVAEQNMTSLAAGMASEGYHVFIYSIANFPTFRCAEQIRNDVAYHQLPVTIVTVGGGVAYGALGYSHHAVQDYALIRTMPDMLIAAPADSFEVRACLNYLIENPQPSYFRLGRGGEPVFNESIPSISPGKLNIINKGMDNSLIYISTGTSCGVITDKKHTHYSMPLWGMAWKQTAKNSIIEVCQHKIMTLEDHLIDGGFGSWVMESALGEKLEISIKALNQKVCGEVGSQEALFKYGGLVN